MSPASAGGAARDDYHPPMDSKATPSPRPASACAAVSAVSDHFDTRTAATEVAERLASSLDGPCDLLLLFGSFHHRSAFTAAGEIVRAALRPEVTLGTTAESVLGDDREIEGRAGLSALALRLPNVRLNPFVLSRENLRETMPDPASARATLGVGEDTRAILLLADPFSIPAPALLGSIDRARPDERAMPVIGGLASGASQPGMNVLLMNDASLAAGAIGVSVGGDLRVDPLVSQGSRPIGKPHVVTKAKANAIVELGGRKALDVLRETGQRLSEQERTMLTRGLLVGVVINEYKDRFGRGDFVIRDVLGFHQQVGAIAVGDEMRVGQTIQFHVRDQATASEDLQLLLDKEQLREPPFACLLFTCNGRGSRLFNEPNHDIDLVRSRLGDPPVAGFFASGEIGPIGRRSFLHGQTASVALFRTAEDSPDGE